MIININPDKRIIEIPASEKILGVCNDKNSNVKTFRCPKIVGKNVDLSELSIRINYVNAADEEDQYVCDTPTVLNEDGVDYVEFEWLIGQKAVYSPGTVKFIVCAVKTDDDAKIQIEWNTTIAQASVLEGLELTAAPEEEIINSDLYNLLLNRLLAAGAGGSGGSVLPETSFTDQNKNSTSKVPSMAAVSGLVEKANANKVDQATYDSAMQNKADKSYAYSKSESDGRYALKGEGGGTVSGSVVTVTSSLTSGTKVAEITVDGSKKTLYAPTPIDAYTKTEADNKYATKSVVNGKADKSEVPTDDHINALIDAKVQTPYDDSAVRTLIDGKVDKVTGKGLSTNDYTTAEKNKLASLSNYDDTALRTIINGKANTGDSYTKEESDNKYALKGESVGSSVEVATMDEALAYLDIAILDLEIEVM